MGYEAAVEGAYLAVEDEDADGEPRDSIRDIAEPSGVVTSVPRNEPDVFPVLVGDDAPAVVFLVVDPAFAMEGLTHERRVHRRNSGKYDRRHRRSLYHRQPCPPPRRALASRQPGGVHG